MPTYCFDCEKCGVPFEHGGSVHEPLQEAKCPKCGGLGKRNIPMEQRGHGKDGCDLYRKWVSRAMGVQPQQAAAFRKQCAPHGIKVDAKGNVVCTSAAQRKRAMKVLGYVDLAPV